MGLRERNAERTRALITETAVTLFLEHGYEHTTMEQIAEQAQIGTTTLYRYYPTKDQMVIGPLALHGQMADELRARPEDESLDLALGHALLALLATPRPDADRLDRLATVLESTPVLQTRLLQEFIKERDLLEQAIAERLGRPSDDLFCRMTARVATSVLELIAGPDQGSTAADNATAISETVALLRDTLTTLRHEPPVLPRIDG